MTCVCPPQLCAQVRVCQYFYFMFLILEVMLMALFPVGTICSNLFCCVFCHIYRIREIYYYIGEGNHREHLVPLWLSAWLYCLCNIYFSKVQIFIWHAKCPAHLLQRQNILPWLCKTVALSSFYWKLVLRLIKKEIIVCDLWFGIRRRGCGFDLTFRGGGDCL